jgi:hypothetical protein
MLKLIYTENGICVEQVHASLETIVAQRVALAVRCNQSLWIEPGEAAFLVPACRYTLKQLEALPCSDKHPKLSVEVVDVDYAEVQIEGVWLAEDSDADEGIFLAIYPDVTEALLVHLCESLPKPVSSAQ